MTPRTTYVVVGGFCGLTWAAALRGWMAQLARGESESVVTWLTLVLVLLPGLVIGGFAVWLITARAVGGDTFALDTTHGLWVSTLYESLLVVFALAASIPFRSTAVVTDRVGPRVHPQPARRVQGLDVA